MNPLKTFSSEERRRYSIGLSRQSRGGAWFFGGMSVLFTGAAILGLLGAIPLADDVDGGFMLATAIIVAVGGALLARFFGNHRNKIDRELQGGYRIVSAKIISISERSETGQTVRIELRDSSGASIAGGQVVANAANVKVGDSVDVFVLADNVSFFSEALEKCMALGKLEGPMSG